MSVAGAGQAVRLGCLDARTRVAMGMAASVPVSVALLAVLLWPVVDHGRVVLWGAVVTVTAALDTAASWRWGRVRSRGGPTPLAEATMVATTAAMSSAWAAVVLIAPHGAAHRDVAMLVLCFLVASTANNQIVNAASTRCFLAFHVPLCTIVFAAYLGGGRFEHLVAAGAVFMAVLALGLHRTANGVVVGAHRLADDNARLADELSGANTELEQANGSLEHRATHDPLTGLVNRARFLAELDGALEASPGQVAVLFLDVDRFKVLNDSLGHVAGDVLLCDLAERARGALDDGDVLARHGGDELTALLRDVRSPVDALVRAERVRTAARGTYAIEGRRVPASISAGLAVAGRADTADDLLRHADAALYRAKQAGRDRVELFDEHLRADLRRKVDDEGELADGLARGEVFAWFQPEIELGPGCIVGAEALARWAHPRRGLLTASEFVGLAAEAGQLDAVTEAAFVATTRLLARLAPTRRDLTVGINLPPAQLARRSVIDRVGRVLDEAACPASMLSVEVTESAVLSAGAAARDVLGTLRAMGTRIVLDDVGAGSSSLSLLAELSFDVVKIDQSFIGPIATSARHRAVVETLLTLADRLGSGVVATGVETVEQEAVLVELGCPRVQGLRFAPALAPDRLLAALGLVTGRPATPLRV